MGTFECQEPPSSGAYETHLGNTSTKSYAGSCPDRCGVNPTCLSEGIESKATVSGVQNHINNCFGSPAGRMVVGSSTARRYGHFSRGMHIHRPSMHSIHALALCRRSRPLSRHSLVIAFGLQTTTIFSRAFG